MRTEGLQRQVGDPATVDSGAANGGEARERWPVVVALAEIALLQRGEQLGADVQAVTQVTR